MKRYPKTYPKSILITVLIVISTALTMELLHRFSPNEPVADTALVEAPALISCLDLQRELNRRDPKLKLAEDGICGPATMAAWDEVVFNGYALSLWPEDTK